MLWGMRTTGPARRLGVAMVTVALAASLAGCAAPKTVQVTEKPSPSSSAVFTSNAEALAAAKAVYLRYGELTEQVLADGGANFERMRDVLTSAEYADEAKSAESLKTDKIHTKGSSTLIAFKLQSADLDAGQVVAYACSDDSKVRVLNADGKDVTPASRAARATVVVTFAYSSSGLRVARSVTWSGKSIC